MFYTDQQLVNNEDGYNKEYMLHQAEIKFMHFIRSTEENGVYIYREQLKNNSLRGQYFICFEMLHLTNFDENLAQAFRQNPSDFIKVFETAVATIYKNDFYDNQGKIEFLLNSEAAFKCPTGFYLGE